MANVLSPICLYTQSCAANVALRVFTLINLCEHVGACVCEVKHSRTLSPSSDGTLNPTPTLSLCIYDVYIHSLLPPLPLICAAGVWKVTLQLYHNNIIHCVHAAVPLWIVCRCVYTCIGGV